MNIRFVAFAALILVSCQEKGPSAEQLKYEEMQKELQQLQAEYKEYHRKVVDGRGVIVHDDLDELAASSQKAEKLVSDLELEIADLEKECADLEKTLGGYKSKLAEQ